MGKTKVITEAQKKKLSEIKERYPWLSIINHEQFCQLYETELFPISNKPRLYKNVQTNIENTLNSFSYAFRNLPFSYQDKIVLSRSFDFVITTLLQRLEFALKTKKVKKQHGEKFDLDYSYELYQKFFNIGLQGLINTMPNEFQPYLKSQIKPMLLLMLSIVKFSKSYDPNMISNLNFPTFVFSDRELSPVNF